MMNRTLISFTFSPRCRFATKRFLCSINNGTTIDSNEVSKFQNYVQFWWNEEGEMKALHSMNSIRVPFIRDCLKNRNILHKQFVNSSTPLKHLNILDVGCGGGILCEPLSKLGANITGIDACKDLIDCAQIHANENCEIKQDIKYVHGSLENYVDSFKNSFDAVVSSECVEHVSCKETYLKSCIDVLKPGGSMFITTLNKTTLSWLLGIVGAEYIFNIVPKGTHDWDKFVSPNIIQKLLENNEMEVRATQGLLYNPCNNKWTWISRTDVNYAVHAIKNC